MARLSWRRSIMFGALLFGAAQLGRCELTNPATDPALAADHHPLVPSDVAVLLRRSCADCHSNDTRWPAYSRVAPLSWIVWYDVDRARRYLNLSNLGRYSPRRALVWFGTVCDAVRTGRMPLPRYTWAHAEARLSPAERERLCVWAADVERALRLQTDDEASR